MEQSDLVKKYNFDQWGMNNPEDNAEKELIALRESTHKALLKSWAEVEALHEESTKSLEMICHLNTELEDAKMELAKSKIRIHKLEEEVKFYHSVPEILQKRIEEKKKRLKRKHQRSQSMQFVSNLVAPSVSMAMPSFSRSPSISHSSVPASMKYSQSCSQLLSLITKTSSITKIGDGSNGHGHSSGQVDGTTNNSSLSPPMNITTSIRPSSLSSNSPNIAQSTHSCPDHVLVCPTRLHDDDNEMNEIKEHDVLSNDGDEEESSAYDDHELSLKLSSRDAVIETLEKVAKDNLFQMVVMEEEMNRMRELLQAHQIEY